MSQTPLKPNTALFLEELQKRVEVPLDDFSRFLELWEPMNLKKNEFIMRVGEVPKFSIFVMNGCLRQYLVNEKGDESIVYFAEERHWIGDLPAMRAKTPTVYNFQAIEPCELLLISAENWEKAFVNFPWWTEAHMKGNQIWALKLQQRIAEMNTMTSEERYLSLLKEKPQLFQRVPQHFIASYLGISPETLSRIRKKIAFF